MEPAMKLSAPRRLTTLSFLVTGALWIGCSADAGNGGYAAPSTTPAPTSSEDESADDDAGEGVSNVVDAAKLEADAGKKKKKDAGQLLEEDAGDPPVTPPPTTVDAGNKKDAATASACNTVPLGTVTPVAVSGFGAALTGGQLVDGIYVLTEYKRYISGTSNSTFPAISMGLEIRGSTLQFAIFGYGRSTYTFTKGSNTLSLTKTCPSAGAATWDYQISGDTLTLYGIPPSNGIWYATFEKQP